MQRYFRPAARLVILNEKNEILLVRHKRYWALPGGGIDIGESIQTALNRESMEELNTPAQMDQIIFIQDYLDERREGKIHALEYFCTIKNAQDFENVLQNCQDASHSFEYVEIDWFDVDNFPEKFMPTAFPEVIKKYIENKNNFPTKYVTEIK